MKLYKLTDTNGQTQNKTQWGENITHSIPAKEQSTNLCTSGILHAYKDINLALLLNPIHANIVYFQLWEAEGDIVVEDWGKVGCHKLTTIKKISFPDWYQDEKIRKKIQILFAILCAEEVLIYYEKFNSSDKRPYKAIEAAKNYLNNGYSAYYIVSDIAAAAVDAADAAAAAAYAASAAAASAASAAAYAAYATAYTAAAYAAASAASVASAAAYASAAYAAGYATAKTIAVKIDLIKLAKLAIQKINKGNKIS